MLARGLQNTTHLTKTMYKFDLENPLVIETPFTKETEW